MRISTDVRRDSMWVPLSRRGSLFCRDESWVDPWRRDTSTVLLVHGIGESHDVWYGWMPYLLRECRVLRLDLRGCGSSSMPGDEGLSLDSLAFDLRTLLDRLDVRRAHVVGAKFGGTIATAMALQYPECVQSLALFCAPLGPTVSQSPAAGEAPDESHRLGSNSAYITQWGFDHWVRETMMARLGSTVTARQIDWWIELMSSADEKVVLEMTSLAASVDFRRSLSRLACPALFVTADASPLLPIELVQQWASMAASAEAISIPGDGYHIAAVDPERCASLALTFWRELTGSS